MKPVIVVDTREQKAYSFDSDRAGTLKAALPAGDYSLAGMEGAVAVERKSLDDFVSTVIHARKRFNAELNRLAGYQSACVVVEGSLADVMEHRYKGEAHPLSVVGSAISTIVDFRIPVYFCSNRQLARLFTQEFLLRFHAREARS